MFVKIKDRCHILGYKGLPNTQWETPWRQPQGDAHTLFLGWEFIKGLEKNAMQKRVRVPPHQCHCNSQHGIRTSIAQRLVAELLSWLERAATGMCRFFNIFESALCGLYECITRPYWSGVSPRSLINAKLIDVSVDHWRFRLSDCHSLVFDLFRIKMVPGHP